MHNRVNGEGGAQMDAAGACNVAGALVPRKPGSAVLMATGAPWIKFKGQRAFCNHCGASIQVQDRPGFVAKHSKCPKPVQPVLVCKCPCRDCEQRILETKVLCSTHWSRLPLALRNKIGFYQRALMRAEHEDKKRRLANRLVDLRQQALDIVNQPAKNQPGGDLF